MNKNAFDQTQIGNMRLKNRLFRAATGERHAVNGHITEKDIEVYENLAKGGVGTIITGYAYVAGYPCGNGMLGIYDDSFIPEYRKLTEMLHRYNVNIVLQLVHCGSLIYSDTPIGKTLGPSAVKNLNSNITPARMQKEDIREVQEAFADAALRAKMAGFDGIEIHGAHGFLLSQFLTPYYNQRNDEYGGTNENRARMLLETYQLVRERVGSDYPVFVKINSADGIDEGIDLSGFMAACELLVHAGIDAIEVSGAWYSLKGNSYFREYAEKMAADNKVPVILTGGIRNLDTINELLENTAIEYFAMSRPFIAEPDLVNRWASSEAQKSKCISCNGCTRMEELKCILNP